ncbi:MAG: cytochrome c [Gemmatimonadaceae bacterium]|nr:cytochrome c [Gemmatimonadaceae bacterium]NUQ92424.1 cytochrome c [Gemmatimonadaceae bacterium]NUR18028.1 cytochrome c [Gemmatimonadaceae bacterium]NUS97447.1 cytochrome c [Gemmatimonadaceae bacterium]
MPADRMLARARRLALLAAGATLVSACSWFTDFKDQPDVDPWESPADTIGARGNPQFSVAVTGRTAPGYMASYANGGKVLDDTLAALRNPVPADARSLDNGRKYYQINCEVCHGLAGGAAPTAAGAGAMGDGPVAGPKYGMYPPSLRTDRVRNFSDGYIWGIIRNGRGIMPSYDRIEEMDRWDVVNYIRALQQPNVTVPVTPAGKPGETGKTVPGYTRTGPTRPAPYLRPDGHSSYETVNGASPASATDTTTTTTQGATAPAPSAPTNPPESQP